MPRAPAKPAAAMIAVCWKEMAFERDGIGHEEIRRSHSGLLAVGTLACRRCDAPVSPGERPLRLLEPIDCPYCRHTGVVRDFLSLETPARPAVVEVRLRGSSSRA
jgi:DNA-directed RNA polymerase subunit RPC12/RpoP